LETAEAHDWARRVCIGFPRPELHRYLRAVQRAAQEHPYSFPLGLSRVRMPGLADIYCPQDLVDLSTNSGGQPANAGPLGAPAWARLLRRHRNLLVRGGPGAGKSTLLRQIAAALAHDALDGHPADYLPVLLHARDLAAGQPLADAIYEGATRFLHTALVRQLPIGIFEAAPLPGVCWLVLVDGLDEIRDHEAREAALHALGDGLDESAWRFVAATRPLPEDDFRELRPKFGESSSAHSLATSSGGSRSAGSASWLIMTPKEWPLASRNTSNSLAATGCQLARWPQRCSAHWSPTLPQNPCRSAALGRVL
jgi:hypothetical protein